MIFANTLFFTANKPVTGTYAIAYNSTYSGGGGGGQIINATVNGSSTNGFCINMDPTPTSNGFTVYVRTLAGVLTDLAVFFTVF